MAEPDPPVEFVAVIEELEIQQVHLHNGIDNGNKRRSLIDTYFTEYCIIFCTIWKTISF